MSTQKDAFDFIEDEPAGAPKRSSVSPLLRLGTLYFLLAAIVLIVYFVFIYFNPHHALNPFPPPQEGAAAVSAALPTATAELSIEPTPTGEEVLLAEEATPTSAPSATPTAAGVTRTEVYPTPTDVVLNTETPAGTPEARSHYVAQDGTPSYLAHTSGCTGLYVAGNVTDLDDDPVMLLTVRATGMLGDQPIDLEVLSGSSPAYTESGWEIQLSDQLVASTGAITIALYEQGGWQPVSDEVVIDTMNDCAQNLVVVNFVQERDAGD